MLWEARACKTTSSTFDQTYHFCDPQTALKKKNVEGEILNIGYGKGYKVKEVIDNILKLFPNKKRISISLSKDNKKELKILFPNINKAKRYLNWQPKISLIEGLKRLI